MPGAGPDGTYAFLYPPTPEHVPVFSDCWTTQQVNGTFTNCPLKFSTANLLLAVASATALDHAPRNHSKWDNTKFRYIGRSFGVGSPAGLTDDHVTSLTNIQHYTYREAGLVTETDCRYNDSAAYYLHEETRKLMIYPNLYLAIGALPNSNWTLIQEHPNYMQILESDKKMFGYDYYAQVGLGNPDGIVSTYNRAPPTPDDPIGYYFGISAGKSYHQLNRFQCRLEIKPTVVEVVVSVLNGSIIATRNETPTVQDPDPSGHLRRRAVISLNLSFIVSSLYVSTVGDAFMANVRN